MSTILLFLLVFSVIALMLCFLSNEPPIAMLPLLVVTAALIIINLEYHFNKTQEVNREVQAEQQLVDKKDFESLKKKYGKKRVWLVRSRFNRSNSSGSLTLEEAEEKRSKMEEQTRLYLEVDKIYETNEK